MNINPTDTPFGPPDPTPAVKRAGRAIWEHDNGHTTWPPADPLEIGPAEDAGRAALGAGLHVEEMARAIADHGSWSTYGEIGVACTCGADLGAIPLSRPGYDVHHGHQAAMIRAALLGEEAKSDA